MLLIRRESFYIVWYEGILKHKFLLLQVFKLCFLFYNNCCSEFWYSDTTNIRRQSFKLWISNPTRSYPTLVSYSIIYYATVRLTAVEYEVYVTVWFCGIFSVGSWIIIIKVIKYELLVLRSCKMHGVNKFDI